MAELQAGASERSRQLRSELRAKFAGVEVPGAGELLDRLLQVRVEDYDGRSGWHRFREARKRLREAKTAGARHDAALAIVAAGLDLFGLPEAEAEGVADPVTVEPDQLRLVAYEVLVEG